MPTPQPKSCNFNKLFQYIKNPPHYRTESETKSNYQTQGAESLNLVVRETPLRETEYKPQMIFPSLNSPQVREHAGPIYVSSTNHGSFSNPRIQKWVSKLAQTVGDADKQTYFVGHSMGCQTIVRYLEKLPENGYYKPKATSTQHKINASEVHGSLLSVFALSFLKPNSVNLSGSFWATNLNIRISYSK